MKEQVLIYIETGAVIASGYQDMTKDSKYNVSFTVIRSDAPVGVLVKNRHNKTYHRWNGSSYVIVDSTSEKNLDRFNESRHKKFKVVDPLTDRHRDEVELGAGTTLTGEQYIELLTYRKALRDMPAQGGFDPTNPTWPAVPVF